METPQATEGLWTEIVLDSDLHILQLINTDPRILWECSNPSGHMGQPLKTLVNGAPAPNRIQYAKLEEALMRACQSKRPVYEEYIVFLSNGEIVHIGLHIRCTASTIHLYAAEIPTDDYERLRGQAAVQPASSNFLPAIYESLPMGLEVYDGDGRLIDINSKQLEFMKVDKKSDVLGLNLFDNPNLSPEIKDRLLAGENVRSFLEYDFEKAKSYFDCNATDTHYFDVLIFIIKNTYGKVDKYLAIVQDQTDYVSLRKEVERISNETETILESIPVGVELYNTDGELIYLNNADCRIFGVDKQEILASSINIADNPNLPQEIKQAVLAGEKVHVNFSCNFNKIYENHYYSSTQTESVKHIDCNGRPVLDLNGRIEKYVFIIEDVTESVSTKEKLLQSKQKSELVMQASEIMLWEFDTDKQWFTSENEYLNSYDSSRPITIEDYLSAIHPEDRLLGEEIINRMLTGEDFTFSHDFRAKYFADEDWQFCTICGAPFAKNAEGRIVKYVGSRKNNSELVRQRMFQEKVLNNIALPIHIKDPNDDYRYVFCNEESKRVLGTKVGLRAYNLFDEQQLSRIEQTDREVVTTGKSYMGNEYITLKDGRVYDMIVQKSIIFDGSRRLLLTVSWDQSLVNELERKTKILTLSVNSLNAFTWYYDDDTKVLSFGEGFERNGRNPERVNSLEKFADCIHPEDRQLFINRMNEVLLNDTGDFAVEYRIDLVGNGEYEWWECRGILETAIFEDVPHKYMYGMDINIDNHKQVELTLLKNKKELDRLIRQNELVLNNTNSALVYLSTDYVVQWENISAHLKEGAFETYRTGEQCFMTARKNTKPCEHCVMSQALKSGRMEQTIYKLKENHTVEIFATPVFSEDIEGQIEGVVLRIDDVTERERVFAELKEAKLQAEQSDRLKSAFLANMSHEIRTPLNAIVGFSDLLMNSEEVEEKEEYMQIINTNNDLLLKLISDILDLSKIEAGAVELKEEEFDLAQYFDNVVSVMEVRLHNPKVQLLVNNPYQHCLIRSDKNRIVQILTNYVTNAIKYTPAGSIEMGYEVVDEGVRFYVKDTGIGIPDEKKDRVFHRFEKLDEFAQGTGLGLSICKAIVEAMGGSVGFESVYGEGSTFWAIIYCKPQME